MSEADTKAWADFLREKYGITTPIFEDEEGLPLQLFEDEIEEFNQTDEPDPMTLWDARFGNESLWGSFSCLPY